MGRKRLQTDLNVTRRSVAFAFCRYGMGCPTIKDMAIDLEIFGGLRESRDEEVSSSWYGYADGSHHPSKAKLELMDRRVNGVIALLDSDLWTLLGPEKISPDMFQAIVLKLPSEMVNVLMSGPDPITNMIKPLLFRLPEDFYFVQRHRSLQTVAALLAWAHLCKLEDTELDDDPIHLDIRDCTQYCLHTAGRLFLKLWMRSPLDLYIGRVWNQMRQRFFKPLLGEFEPGPCEPLLFELDIIRGVSERLEIIGPSWRELDDLLSIADRSHFSMISKAAIDLWVSWEDGAEIVKPKSGPIAVLEAAYHELYGQYPEGHWFGDYMPPEDEFRKWDIEFQNAKPAT